MVIKLFHDKSQPATRYLVVGNGLTDEKFRKFKILEICLARGVYCIFGIEASMKYYFVLVFNNSAKFVKFAL